MSIVRKPAGADDASLRRQANALLAESDTKGEPQGKAFSGPPDALRDIAECVRKIMAGV